MSTGIKQKDKTSGIDYIRIVYYEFLEARAYNIKEEESVDLPLVS